VVVAEAVDRWHQWIVEWDFPDGVYVLRGAVETSAARVCD